MQYEKPFTLRYKYTSFFDAQSKGVKLFLRFLFLLYSLLQNLNGLVNRFAYFGGALHLNVGPAPPNIMAFKDF
jgi:hypothetical protein